MHKLLLCLTTIMALAIALFHDASYSYVPFLLLVALWSYIAIWYLLLKRVQTDVYVADEVVWITVQMPAFMRLFVTFSCNVKHVLSEEAIALHTTQHIASPTETFTLPLPTTYCGTVHVHDGMLTLRDTLGIISVKHAVELAPTIIWPASTNQTVEASTTAMYTLLGSDGGAREKVTPYRPGDPLKYIHWPISAKLQTLVVQQHAFMETQQQSFALYFNDVQTLSQYDAFMRLCYHLVSSPQCQHITIWKDDWQTYDVTEPPQITALFTYLLNAPLSQLYAPSLPAMKAIRYEGGHA